MVGHTPHGFGNGSWFWSLPLLILLVCLVGCAPEAGTPEPGPALDQNEKAEPAPVPPGPVPLKSAADMAAFLTTGRFDRVGTRERGDTWWHFRKDGAFEAQQGADRLEGRWTAAANELRLTELQLIRDGRSTASPDRKLPLKWLDGKLNIQIDGRQYRRYGRP